MALANVDGLAAYDEEAKALSTLEAHPLANMVNFDGLALAVARGDTAVVSAALEADESAVVSALAPFVVKHLGMIQGIPLAAVAIAFGHNDLAIMLHKAMGSPDDFGMWESFYAACAAAKANFDLVDALMPDRPTYEVAAAACLSADAAFVERLLEEQAVPVAGSDEIVSINAAAMTCDQAFYKALLELEVPNDVHAEAATFAATQGNVEFFDWMVDEYELSDDSLAIGHISWLCAAAWGGHNDLIRSLMEKRGLSPNGTDERSDSQPICYAIAGGHVNTVDLLIELGAKISDPSGVGELLDEVTDIAMAEDGMPTFGTIESAAKVVKHLRETHGVDIPFPGGGA